MTAATSRPAAGLVVIPPTKTHRDENFPVASRFIAADKRGPILAFYRFVRAADDVADSPDLTPEAKRARLDALEAALLEGGAGEPLAAALVAVDRAHGAGIAQARLLLDAFRQDAVKGRYADWAELVDYCRRSADPVGRFLLRLHGEGPAADGPSDALCTALQILNHLQDLGRDRAALDRVYLPEPWMAAAGGEAAFFAPANAEGRRPVLEAALDRVDAMLATAQGLPGRLADRRLALESATIVALARRLSARLRARDPIAVRVALGKGDFARAVAGSAAARLAGFPSRDRAIVRGMVARSGSSFKLGMASLKAERRRGIHAVYAFCRAVDDIADGAAPAPERARFLAAWREEVAALPEAPRTPVGRELAWAMHRFDLPRAELDALLDGMATDAAARVRLADDAALDLYCRRVAGAVGLLSIRVFGAPEAEAFALALGRTLQLVNILRDIDEDARLERVYVPLARLSALGLPDAPAAALVAQAGFARACQGLAEEAAAGFAATDRLLGDLDPRPLKPALLMRAGYRRLLDRLIQRGFARRGPRLRLGALDRVRLMTLAVGGVR